MAFKSWSSIYEQTISNIEVRALVEDITLLHVNAEYSYVQFPDGMETIISTRHLAPIDEENLGSTKDLFDQITCLNVKPYLSMQPLLIVPVY